MTYSSQHDTAGWQLAASWLMFIRIGFLHRTACLSAWPGEKGLNIMWPSC